MQSTITSKGQITLPKGVREDLGLGQGDRVEFIKQNDGKYTLIPITNSLSSLRGFLPKPKKALTLEQMDAAIKNSRKDN